MRLREEIRSPLEEAELQTINRQRRAARRKLERESKIPIRPDEHDFHDKVFACAMRLPL